MRHFLPSAPASASEKFLQAFGQSSIESGQDYARKRSMADQMRQENESLLKSTGLDLSGIQDPKIRQQMIAEDLQGKNQRALQKEKYDRESENPKKKEVERTYDKEISKKRADQYIKAEENIGKSTEYIKSLDRLEELSQNLRGPAGYIKSFLGSESAAELNAAGTTIIEPILKLFNPTGAIPTAKIRMIQSKHSPSAYDTQATINGKLSAIRRFAEAGQERAIKFVQLMDDYDGNPSKEALRRYHEESAMILDDLDKESEKSEKSERKPLLDIFA